MGKIIRKAAAATCAFLAACLWMLADFLWGANQPRQYGNVSELSPEARRVIAAMEALQRAQPPVYEPDDAPTEPYYPARLLDILDAASGDQFQREGFDTPDMDSDQ